MASSRSGDDSSFDSLAREILVLRKKVYKIVYGGDSGPHSLIDEEYGDKNDKEYEVKFDGEIINGVEHDRTQFDGAEFICTQDTDLDTNISYESGMTGGIFPYSSWNRVCDDEKDESVHVWAIGCRLVMVGGYRAEGGTDHITATSPSGKGFLFCVGRWQQKLQMCNIADAVVKCQQQTEKQASEIATLRKANFEKDKRIRELTALCKQRDKDLNEMEEWIADFQPVMDENERRISRQENTIMELKEELNRLMNLATTLIVLVLSKHWLNFTSSYQVRLPWMKQ